MLSIYIQILELIKKKTVLTCCVICTKLELIHTVIWHLLIFHEKKHGPGGMDGWVGGRAGFRTANSNQQIFQQRNKSVWKLRSHQSLDQSTKLLEIWIHTVCKKANMFCSLIFWLVQLVGSSSAVCHTKHHFSCKCQHILTALANAVIKLFLSFWFNIHIRAAVQN